MTYIPALLEIRTLDNLGNQVTLVDLLNNGNGIIMGSWRPKRAQMKGGGVYQDSPYADGRRLVHAVYDNVTEPLVLTMTNDAPDSTFYHDSLLTQALQDAIDYGRNTWGSQPVFLAMQPRGGTNEQYALIVNGRTEEFADPFGSLAYQFMAPRSVADEIPLVIEREHWLETPPTLSVALELSAVQAYPESFALSFANTGDLVNAGSDASIDNLTAAAGGFTAEAWVRVTNFSSAFRIINKGQWELRYSAGALTAVILAATTNATTTSATSLTAAVWHHVAITYLNTGSRQIQIWVDGLEVAYSTQTAAVGALTSDAAASLIIGNTSAGTATFSGLIGWTRLSSTSRYTAAFTPPSRCAPPAVDASTEAQWNMQEGRGTAVDNAEGTAGSDGVITGAIWSSARDGGSACGSRNYGNVNSSGTRVPTTNNQVYISNKHSMAQITNWHSGTGGGNRIDAAFPTAIVSSTTTVPAYFGVDGTLPNNGPFDSLVFDIGTAQVGATLVWEYWDGAAWTSMSVTDNTNSFQNTGVNSVHWIPPSGWTAASPGGSLPSGYYVRVRATVTGSVSATQQNRNPYTICWPYVEVQAAAVPGEIEALARLWIHGQSGSSTSLPAPRTVVAGLRSASRGGAFTPYINISDTQNVPGTVIKIAGGMAYAADLLSPTGRALVFTATGGSTVYFSIEFLSTIASQYRGKFLMFLRARSTSEWDFDIQYHRDIGSFRSSVFHAVEKSLSAAGTSVQIVTAFGEVVVPNDVQEFEISIGVTTTSGSGDLYVTDLVLIPADEWVARYDTQFDYSGNENYGSTPMLRGGTQKFYLDINQLYNKATYGDLVLTESAVTKDKFTPQVSRVFWQRGEKQRLWFLQMGRMNGTTATAPVAMPFQSLSVQAFRNAQYLGIRGNQ